MELAPTAAPQENPRVRPDRNTVMEINSTLGTSMNIKPNPMATAEKIAARTRLLRFIIF